MPVARQVTQWWTVIQPTPNPPSSPRPRNRVLAVVAVLALAATGLAAVFLAHGNAQASLRSSRDQAQATERDAQARLQALADLSAATRQAQLALQAASGLPDLAGLQAQLAQATAQFEAALAASTLPSVAPGYVPGGNMSAYLHASVPTPLVAPDFSGRLDLSAAGVASLTGSASPVDPPTGPHVPGTGVASADQVVLQLLGSYGALEDALATVQGLLPAGTGAVPDPSTLLGGGVPLPVAVPGLPAGVGGSYPQPVQDANDAADPDGTGAMQAAAHAAGLLRASQTAVGQSTDNLNALLDVYQQLAPLVQQLIQQTRDAATQAGHDLPAQAQRNIDALTSASDQARAATLQAIGEYRAAVQQAAQDATGRVDRVLQQRVDAVRDAGRDVGAQLDAQTESLKELLQARHAAIQAISDSALATLAQLGTQGIDVSDDVAGVQAAAQAAQHTVDASLGKLLDDVAAARSQAMGTVDATIKDATSAAADVRAGVTAAVADTLAQTQLTSQFVVDLAQAQLVQDVAATQDLAARTLANVTHAANQRVHAVLDQALALTGATPRLVDATSGLVGQLANLTQVEVGKDVDYIAKVAHDYGQVPVGERAQQAAYLTAVADADGHTLDSVLASGTHLQDVIQQVLDAAGAARGQILSLA